MRAWLVVAALGVAGALPAQTGSVHGVAVDRETGAALSHASVSVLGGGGERLTSGSGEFVLTALTAGDVRLRIRHIGFAPLDTTIRVDAGAVSELRASLTHVAIRLEAVRTTGTSECVSGGLPTDFPDSTLAIAYRQLEQNALQYWVLVNEYPFVSTIERVYANQYDHDRKVTRRDTFELSSKGSPVYEPGQVVQSRGGGYFVAIPTLTVFADTAFVRSHCFTSGGASRLGGADVIQIDFRTVERIRTPDINGAIYLDARTFMVRRSVVWLSRTNGPVAEYDSIGITTDYSEIVAGIPAIGRSTALNHYRSRAFVPNRVVGVEQNHRLLAIRFLSASPVAGDTARARPPLINDETINTANLAGSRRELGCGVGAADLVTTRDDRRCQRLSATFISRPPDTARRGAQ